MAFPLPSSAPGGVTPPSLSNWQFQFGSLVFGAGTSFGVTSIKGLALATIRSQDVALPRDSGELAGLDVYGGRDVTVDMWMTAGGSGLVPNDVALSNAMQLGLATEQPLWFQLPGMPVLCVMARVRKRDTAWDAEYAAGAVAKPSLALHCTDPRIYTAGASTTINLGSVGGGGLTFPVGPFPVTFGATTPATATITNSGTMESRPILVFNGPLTNPWVSNLTAAGSPIVQVSNPYQSSYTVLAGDQLLVDLNTPHRVLYYSGGIATGVTPSSVRYWLTFGSSWWNLPADTASTIEFGSQDSTATGGSVEVWAASAYQL